MRVRCIAPYTAKMAMGHVASSAPGASQMYMSVLIGSCGSSGPVITLKPLWGSPGTELSTWSTGSLCCIRAIQRTRIASRPLRSYTAIQRYTLYSYTSLYTIQAIQHPSEQNWTMHRERPRQKPIQMRLRYRRKIPWAPAVYRRNSREHR